MAVLALSEEGWRKCSRGPEDFLPVTLPTSRPPPLRKHQERAVADVRKGFRRCTRGQLIFPCGTGKTAIATRVAAELDAHTVLVLVPTIQLVAQWGQEFHRWYGKPFNSIVVCSDSEVADGVSFPKYTTVTTEKEELRSVLDEVGDKPKVVFCTYQSSDLLEGAVFDLGVFDEAHNCVGDSAGLFKTALDDKKVRIKKRLFMTATPKIVVCKECKNGVKWASMDDEATFGPVFARMSFGEAITQNLIADYRVTVLEISEEEVERLAPGLSEDAKQEMGVRLGLLKAIKKYKISRTLAFLNSINASEAFAESLGGVRALLPLHLRMPGRFWSTSISSRTSLDECEDILAKIRDNSAEVRVVCNCRKFKEGVDIPGLGAVAIVDPKTSVTEIVQAVSRALRLSHEGKIATIVIPLLVPKGEDIEKRLAASSYSPVWRVVRALCEHDERLVAQLKVLSKKVGKHSDASQIQHLVLPKQLEWDEVDGSDLWGMSAAISVKEMLRYAGVKATIDLTHPEVAKEWHHTKNGKLKPSDVSAGSGQKVWWECSKGHEWEEIVGNRTRGNGCPYHSGRRVMYATSIANTHKALARQWHPTKNVDLKPSDVIAGSRRKVWWKCRKGHEWEAIVHNRTKPNGNGCPYHSGRRVTYETSIATTHKALARQWHPTKNGDLKPSDVSAGMDKKIWWKCCAGHEWEAVVSSRSRNGCPYHSGRRVMYETSIATTHKALARLWHPTKNGALKSSDVSAGSRREIFWKCRKGHEWNKDPHSMLSRKYLCPKCKK